MATISRERGLTDLEVKRQRTEEGQRLLALREDRGQSGVEFADALNGTLGTSYTRHKVADWEAGTRPVPQIVLVHLGLHKQGAEG